VHSVNSVVRNCFCCKAVRTVNQHFNQLKIEQAPVKTFIGKISRGWDFLGYHFDGKHLTVATKTAEKHVVHYRQLYEQLRKKKATSVEMDLALGLYVKRWQRWPPDVCNERGSSIRLQGLQRVVWHTLPILGFVAQCTNH